MNKLDSALLNILIKDARASYADIARQLGISRAHACQEVVSLYIMSDLQSLHIHTLTDSFESFDAFARRRIFNRPEILSVDCKMLMSRVKHRRGGPRL